MEIPPMGLAEKIAIYFIILASYSASVSARFFFPKNIEN